LRGYLTASQRASAQAKRQRDKYLEELNELDNDFREQEQLLAEKNSKLAHYSAEFNELNQDLNEADNLLSNKNQTIADLTQQANQNHNQARKKYDNLKKSIAREGKK
jgi:septal ring factor EnvC (AmiA/AmiB activator)